MGFQGRRRWDGVENCGNMNKPSPRDAGMGRPIIRVCNPACILRRPHRTLLGRAGAAPLSLILACPCDPGVLRRSAWGYGVYGIEPRRQQPMSLPRGLQRKQ